MPTSKRQKRTGARKAGASRPRAKRSKARRESAGPLVLGSHLAIDSANEFKAELLEFSNTDNNKVVVDASSVEVIDTAALQLLVAFANRVHESSRELEWKDVSDAVRNSAQLLGLEDSLALPASSSDTAADGDDGLCPVF